MHSSLLRLTASSVSFASQQVAACNTVASADSSIVIVTRERRLWICVGSAWLRRTPRQFVRFDAQHIRKSCDRLDARIVHSVLERADIGPVHVGLVRQRFLRQRPLASRMRHRLRANTSRISMLDKKGGWLRPRIPIESNQSSRGQPAIRTPRTARSCTKCPLAVIKPNQVVHPTCKRIRACAHDHSCVRRLPARRAARHAV
jgi:hypothetical protein